MESIFADRIADVPRSFIREILKVAIDPSVISFAGGLPNRDLFPVEEIKAACIKVLDTAGRDALQYSASEGFLPLREFIARRYRERRGIEVDPQQVIITTGSQQGLDLIAKTILNEGDRVIIERPGYLGAIQAFSVYGARLHAVPLREDGVDCSALADAPGRFPVKLAYGVPNFQNPTGITYDEATRKNAAAILKGRGILFVEDDPYGELRFLGKDLPSMKSYLPEDTILLGSFSKIFAPALRLGWISCRGEILEKIVVAKQASDLHTDSFAQRVLYQYLCDNDLDRHIATIRSVYKRQRDAMVAAIERRMSPSVRFTRPEGGMFLWVTLPRGTSSMALFEAALRLKVAFVPGDPFYAGDAEGNTLRLNFSSTDESTIEEGIRRLAAALEGMGP